MAYQRGVAEPRGLCWRRDPRAHAGYRVPHLSEGVWPRTSCEYSSVHRSRAHRRAYLRYLSYDDHASQNHFSRLRFKVGMSKRSSPIPAAAVRLTVRATTSGIWPPRSSRQPSVFTSMSHGPHTNRAPTGAGQESIIKTPINLLAGFRSRHRCSGGPESGTRTGLWAGPIRA